MEKRTAKDNLKSFSIIYIIVALFYIIGTIICNFIPELSNPIRNAFNSPELDGMLVFNITAGVVVFLNLWYFWLARRVANGKSKGTFYMILLLLGVISSIVSFFTTGGVGRALSFDAIVDLLGLIFLMAVRKEQN